jgi:hypothetical protein
VTLTQSGAAFDGTPLFAIDAPITISKDGVPWHKGPVVSVPRSAGARSEQLDYEIADPWWYLEQLTYEQQIALGMSSGNTTRISLFGDVSGGHTNKLSVYGVIIKAVGQAAAAGAPMAVGFLGSFGVSPPIADMRDPTCAEVIRAALQGKMQAQLQGDLSRFQEALKTATDDTQKAVLAGQIALIQGYLTAAFKSPDQLKAETLAAEISAKQAELAKLQSK